MSKWERNVTHAIVLFNDKIHLNYIAENGKQMEGCLLYTYTQCNRDLNHFLLVVLFDTLTLIWHEDYSARMQRQSKRKLMLFHNEK